MINSTRENLFCKEKPDIDSWNSHRINGLKWKRKKRQISLKDKTHKEDSCYSSSSPARSSLLSLSPYFKLDCSRGFGNDINRRAPRRSIRQNPRWRLSCRRTLLDSTLKRINIVNWSENNSSEHVIYRCLLWCWRRLIRVYLVDLMAMRGTSTEAYKL